MKPTSEKIGDVIAAMAESADSELLAMTEADVAGQWYWRWEGDRSAEWNTYRFSDALELYKRRCRRWEEHHNGHVCVVERVRDKYVMPRVREFLAVLAAHNGKDSEPGSAGPNRSIVEGQPKPTGAPGAGQTCGMRGYPYHGLTVCRHYGGDGDNACLYNYGCKHQKTSGTQCL